MLAFRPPSARPGPAAVALALSLALAHPPAAPADPPPATGAGPGAKVAAARLVVVDRQIAQGRGAGQFWQVDYKLENAGPTTLVIAPAEVSAEVRGWVSNSRVAAHAAPRPSAVTVTGASGLSATAEVIASADGDRRCRERAVLQVWAGPAAEPPDPIIKAPVRLVALAEQPTLEIAPGADLRVRLRLEHDHHLYGPHDPLLGRRELELHLGPALLKDVLPLDRPTHAYAHAASAEPDWPPPPPAERLDRRVYRTAPDSLHLEAHVGGNQSYRFPERSVRYGTRYRLSYWYLVAPGTEGDCVARTSQFRNTARWKPLPEADHELALDQVGRWAHVERTFRTEPDATHLMLDFRILRSDVGELWIDDVRLEPVDEEPAGP